MNENRRFKNLLLITILIIIGSTGTAIYQLYRTALNEQRSRLQETAQSQARLIEAVARYDRVQAQYLRDKLPDYNATEATVSQIIDAHDSYLGFGATGEFTLARMENDSIIFILQQRHTGLESTQHIPFLSDLAEPMRRALSGESGVIIGPDYRGVQVLAAFEPVAELDLGIVAKIDLSEIRAPFIRSVLIVIMISGIMMIVGIFRFMGISNPIVERLRISDDLIRRGEQKYRNLFEHANDSIFITDPKTGKFVEANLIAPEKLGYTMDELLQLGPNEIAPAIRAEDIQSNIKKLQSGDSLLMGTVHRRKDGTDIPVEISSRLVEYGDSHIIQTFVRDISDRKLSEIAIRNEAHRAGMASDGAVSRSGRRGYCHDRP